MPAFGRARGSRRAPSAEYVAAGPGLALVRVEGAGDAASELLVFSGGGVQGFEALPGAPGDDRVGFPVPLDLVLAAGSEFRLLVGGEEGELERPAEAPPAQPPAPRPDPALAEARAEAEREREARGALEREL